MVCINKVKNQIMKKAKWISFGCLLGIILATGSCKETLQNALGKDISVKNREIVFDVQPSALSQTDADGQDVPELLSGATEEVLYDGILNENVAAELEKNGLSFENLKSFIITQGTLELVTPQGFDLNTFRTAKLYFDNRTALVAKADVVDTAARKVRFTIINGELLDKLKDDKLHVILTGIRPNVVVRLKLVMDYKAKVSLIK